MANPNVLRQIRRFCMQCQGNSSSEVNACTDALCILWSWRQSNNINNDLQKPLAVGTTHRLALRSVRRHCLHCAENTSDVRACTAKNECPLWSLRFGVYPTTYKRVIKRLSQPKRLSLFDY